MPRFYIHQADFSLGTNYTMPEDVVRHINVLRLRVDERICLFNGDGYNYFGYITALTKRSVDVQIENRQVADNESKVAITLLVSLIAGDKFELVIQKAVELGVTRIVPVISARTQRIKVERELHKLEHWRKIIVSASEQCGRAQLAVISQAVPFSVAIEEVADLKFILSPHHSSIPTNSLNLCSVVLLVGPEGGFAEEEILAANQAGYLNLNLGGRILRAETAAIAGLCYVHAHYGDFNLKGVKK